MSLGQSFEMTLAAARTGAEWAWTAIYKDLVPSVLGYLRTRGAPDPEDLTGEVFLEIVRDLHAFDGSERGFRAWVFTIAHHCLLDERRARVRRPLEVMSDEAIDAPDANSAIEDQVLSSVEAERAYRLIARLSADQQDVLLLRTLGEMTIEEVATALGKRPGAVKQLQRRAIARLNRELEREGVTL
jgi:RNA polymerase sigma-70 factor (ECF subfamily)